MALILCGVAGAQSKLVPGIEVFGGYSHMSFQSKDLGFGNWTQMNGWDVGLSIPHIIGGFGIAADASGDYATALKQYNYAIGPQYKWDFDRFRVIGHVLYGGAQTRIEQPGSTFTEASARKRSILLGGQVDIPLTSRISFRAVQADYVITSAFGSNFRNVRVSTGLVYAFGKH